jgi:hypothetical protein
MTIGSVHNLIACVVFRLCVQKRRPFSQATNPVFTVAMPYLHPLNGNSQHDQ